MDKNISIKQIMTTDVLFVGPNDLMSKVSDIFKSHDFHHIPVVEADGTVVGIISKSDYYRLQNTFTLFKRKDAEEYNQAVFRTLLAKEVMTSHVATLHPEDRIQIAVGIFKENLFHAMPIVDDQKKLVGMLSTYDLLNYAFRDEVLIV